MAGRLSQSSCRQHRHPARHPVISDMRAPSSLPRRSVRQSLHLSIPSSLLFIHLLLAEIFGCTSLMPVVPIGKARTTLSSLIPYFLFHLRLMKLRFFLKILLIIYSSTYLSLHSSIMHSSVYPLIMHCFIFLRCLH